MDLDPTALRQKVILEKLLRNQPTLLDRAKAINFSGVKPAVSRFAGFVGLNNPMVRKAIGPVLDTTVGSVMDWGGGMSPVQAFGRNVTGTALGIPAYIAGEAAIPVPFTGIPAYIAANELGKQQFDRFYSGLSNADTTGQGIRVIDDGSETGVPVTEGVGTKLIRTADGQVIRVPVETSVEGSETMSTNGTLSDVVTAEEGTNASDMVDDFLSRREWEHKSRNSPARRSGAFTDDQLWELQQRHREWKADRGR